MLAPILAPATEMLEINSLPYVTKRRASAQWGTNPGPLCYAFITNRRFPLILAGLCALLWRVSR